MARTDSRERILNAAESLFAEKGVRAASLREIGARARANPGSIYFHWKTKAELVREVFARRLGPLDAERLRRLEAAEKEHAPEAVPLEGVLEALVAPMLELLTQQRSGAGFLRLLGRTYNEPDRDLVRMLRRDHGATVERFRDALARALPELPEEQLFVRFHFALGALAYTLGSDASWQLVVGARKRPASWEQVLSELMPFLVAGFGAPSALPDTRRGAA
ncbi:MAG: TetR/AcrR family transcriptional regulator [Myxococcota bacterium]